MAAAPKICRVCQGVYGAGERFCPVDGARLAMPDGVAAADASDPLVGDTLDGRYVVRRVIGRGGMGVVYEAEHLEIGKRVALKVLRQSLTDRADLVERFRREARAVSQISHPHVIEVSDFGQTRFGACYFVMELLRGEDLADTLARERVLDPGRAARIALQCCAGLGAAHAGGLIHRDLKPENVFLCQSSRGGEEVRVVDFGVAKMAETEQAGLDADDTARRLTRTGIVFGTPEYMSPEQARGDCLDERVDVYALGVLMFEMVTGRVPFDGANFMELLRKHTDEPVPTLASRNSQVAVSDAFARVIYRALHKDRIHRYPSASALAQDLRLVPELRRHSDVRPRVPPVAAGAPTGSVAPTSVVSGTASEVPPIGVWQARAARAEAPTGPATVMPTSPSGREVPPSTPSVPPAVSVVPDRAARPAAETRSESLAAASQAERPAQTARTERPTDEGAETASDTASHFRPRPRYRSLVGLSAAAAAAALGLFALRPSTAMVELAPTAVALGVVDGDRVQALDPGIEEGPSFVYSQLRVTSRPRGARVFSKGEGELCEATPCTVTVARNEPLRLRLQHGEARAESRLTPTDPVEDVHIVFPRKRKVAEDPIFSDLKVPAAYR